MTDSIMFHEGNRRLQDQFESRRIADRLENFARTEFAPDDRAFIERAPYFFLATADAEGRPGCSFQRRHAGVRDDHSAVGACFPRL